MKLLLFLKDFVKEYPRHFLGTCVTLLILSTGAAFAAVSVDWNNLPQMYLENTIAKAQTTNIKLSVPQISGGDWIFSATSGGVLRFRTPNNSTTEDVYYSQAIVNSDKTVTLTGSVIRHICENVSRSYISCGDGYQWTAGTIVEYTVDARNINMKANIDRRNVFTARDSIRFSGSGSLGQPTFATTAERDRQLGSSPATGSGLVACVTATSLCYDGLGGTWVARGNTGVGAATEAATGIVQLATVAHQLARTGTDAGPTVLQAKNLTSSGGTVLANGRVFIASGSTLDDTALGLSPGSGEYLRIYQGNPTFMDIFTSTKLVNSGSLTINSFQTGALLNAKQTGTSYFVVEGAVKNGHIRTGGAAPTFSPECTMTTSAGNDTAGKFVVNGVESRCAMYFNKPYTNPPICVVSWSIQTDVNVIRVTTTSSGMLVTGQGSGADFNGSTISYICLEY